MRALSLGELTLGDLAYVIGRSTSSTSRHLRVLRHLGAVRSRRQGRTVYNRLTDAPLAQITRPVLQTVANLAAPA